MWRACMTIAAVSLTASVASAQDIDIAVGHTNPPRQMCLPPPGQQCWPSTTVLLRNRNWHAVQVAFVCTAYDSAGSVLQEASSSSALRTSESGSGLALWVNAKVDDIARVECAVKEMVPINEPRR